MRRTEIPYFSSFPTQKKLFLRASYVESVAYYSPSFFAVVEDYMSYKYICIYRWCCYCTFLRLLFFLPTAQIKNTSPKELYIYQKVDSI